jgi:16S rRNA (cytosine967-C5)-methyltransferase
LLDPQPGERILDACAAPGGKTSFLGAMMRNQGTIVACDRDPKRIRTLEENLARLGLEMTVAVYHDWTSDRVPPELDPNRSFDRILVDAPCTNTGVMRRRVDVRWRLRPEEFDKMQKQQLAILRSVIPLLKPQGALVYSTCSLEAEENEKVVERVLADWPALKLDRVKTSLPFRDGFDGAYAARLIKVP